LIATIPPKVIDEFSDPFKYDEAVDVEGDQTDPLG